MQDARDELEVRTKRFAISAIRLTKQLSHTAEARDALRQLARSASSVGANHRAMRRARSFREFAAKLQVVYEEADEVCYWLEIVREILPDRSESAEALHIEGREIRAIFAKARATSQTPPCRGCSMKPEPIH